MPFNALFVVVTPKSIHEITLGHNGSQISITRHENTAQQISSHSKLFFFFFFKSLSIHICSAMNSNSEGYFLSKRNCKIMVTHIHFLNRNINGIEILTNLERKKKNTQSQKEKQNRPLERWVETMVPQS